MKLPSRTTSTAIAWAMAVCMTLSAVKTSADQDHPGLDPLFSQLKTAPDQATADRITGEIWSLWREVSNPDVANAMAQGAQAMSAKRYRSAYQYFTEVIDRAPDFAEGWNKRATVLFLAKAYDRSIRDIKEVLRLEPRHFGALSGLGLIFLRQGQFRPATQAFRDALAINPYLPRIREALDQLEHRQRSIDEKNAI